MNRDSIVLGPLEVRYTEQGLLVHTADEECVLDAQQSRTLLGFLYDHRREFFNAADELPAWIDGLRKIGMLTDGLG